MRRPTKLPAHDAQALYQRLGESFLGRCTRRFIMMSGLDRCIVLSSQAFTALIPLLVLVSSIAPADQEDVLSDSLIRKFNLSGESADAVEQLFQTPPGAAGTLSAFSALLLLYSGISFTRRLQKMYRAAWGQRKAGVRGGLFAALGLFVLIAEVMIVYGIHGLVRQLRLDWLWALPITAITGVFLWTSIPYLLLNRQVHWRRLVVAGATASVASALLGVATTVYMPPLVADYTEEYGLFGITIAIVGWLLVAAGIVVASTVFGAEFDASEGRWIRRLKERFGLRDPAQPVDVAPDGYSGGLTAGDVLAIVRVLINWLIMTAAVWVATVVVPGLHVSGGFLTFLAISLLLGLVNAVLGPVLQYAAMPLSVVTLGSFALIVNGVLLAVTAGLSERFEIDGLGGAVLGAMVITIVTTVLELVLRPISRTVGIPDEQGDEVKDPYS
ncbi:MAG TPA: YhjD/YihY/BrkB family envelope integrity protein [Nocardioides sp.]|nr:YhjD/YihY/BrkB family envelope integrity protein [Nocardioides sp.]